MRLTSDLKVMTPPDVLPTRDGVCVLPRREKMGVGVSVEGCVSVAAGDTGTYARPGVLPMKGVQKPTLDQQEWMLAWEMS